MEDWQKGKKFYTKDAGCYYGMKAMTLSDLCELISWRTGIPIEDLMKRVQDPKDLETYFECVIFKPGYEFFEQEFKSVTADNKVLAHNSCSLYWPHLPRATPEYQHFYSKLPPTITPTPFLERFLGALLILVKLPSLQMVAKSNTIVKGIPMIDGKQSYWSLSSGSMGNPFIDMPCVQKVLQRVQSANDLTSHCLFAISGMGKTKALLDIGRKHFAVYFDYDNADARYTLGNIVNGTNEQRGKIPDKEARIEYNILLLFAVRLIILMLLKLNEPWATNEQLLLIQLWLFKDDIQYLNASIEALLSHHYKTKEELQDVITWVMSILQKSSSEMFILIDEGKIMLDYYGTNLFSKLVQGLKPYGHLITTSRSLDLLKEMKLLEPHVFYDYHFQKLETAGQFTQLIHHLFDVPNLSDNQVTLIQSRLKGRPSVFVFLAAIAEGVKDYHKQEGLDSNEEILMKLVNDYWEYNTVFYIDSPIKPFMSHQQTPAFKINYIEDYNLLAIICLAESAKGCSFKVKNDNDLLVKGGLLLVNPVTLCYEKAEPMVLEAVKNYCEKHDTMKEWI